MVSVAQDIPTICEWDWNGEPLINYPTSITDSPESFTLPYNYTPPLDEPTESPIATPPISSPIPHDATTWNTVISPQIVHVMTPHHGNVPQILNYSLSTSDVASIAHSYLEAKSAWIIPKQNKITLNCKLEADFKDVSNIYIELEGTLVEVSKLLLSVDAIRTMDGQVTPSRAPLFIQNSQKSMVIPEPVQIFPKEHFDCVANWTKLQFSTTTSGNSTKVGASERFHFIVSLVAHIQQGQHIIALTVNSMRSPPIIVIGQNPGRFTKSKTKQTQEPMVTTPPPHTSHIPHISHISPHTLHTPHTPPTSHTSHTQFIETPPQIPQPKRKRIEEVSGNTAESVFNIEGGKVGINCKPYETLAVGGNILYTGEIFKPSDRRIKRNFTPLNQGNNMAHLHNISQIKLYQYERMDLAGDVPRFIPERGVIAQEVKQIVPSAVTNLGRTTLPNGEEIELQAVNHQELLIETIGATQNLNTKTTNLTEQVENLAEISEEHSSVLQHLSNAVKYIQTNENSQITSKLNILGLGPAWTMFILGFFFYPMFIVGSFYLCSNMWHRQIAGLASLCGVTFCVSELAVLACVVHPIYPYAFVFMYTGYMFFGIVICSAVAISIFVKRLKGKSEAVGVKSKSEYAVTVV